jgi:hypothetical protein
MRGGRAGTLRPAESGSDRVPHDPFSRQADAAALRAMDASARWCRHGGRRRGPANFARLSGDFRWPFRQCGARSCLIAGADGTAPGATGCHVTASAAKSRAASADAGLDKDEDAMSNIVSGTWKLNANSQEGDLVLQIDGTGNVTGIVYGADPIFGFWNDGAQEIVFARQFNPDDAGSIQVYTGHLFAKAAPQVEFPMPGIALAGTFLAFGASGATPERFAFAWSATRAS